MFELPLVFMGGLLGSSHCVGMCGGFALMVGLESRSAWHNLGRQLIYSLGRLFTYLFLGAMIGFFGGQLTEKASLWLNVPALLSIVAGLFLIYQGLKSAGVKLGKSKSASGAPCLTGGLLSTFLRSPSWYHQFLAGLMTGLLPCGLVYAFLAMAAATGSFVWGAAIMGLFGLGTVPLMVATGVGGSLLSLIARQRLLQVAAWCVVLTGVVTVARGSGFVTLPGETAPASCPFCTTTAVDSANSTESIPSERDK